MSFIIQGSRLTAEQIIASFENELARLDAQLESTRVHPYTILDRRMGSPDTLIQLSNIAQIIESNMMVVFNLYREAGRSVGVAASRYSKQTTLTAQLDDISFYARNKLSNEGNAYARDITGADKVYELETALNQISKSLTPKAAGTLQSIYQSFSHIKPTVDFCPEETQEAYRTCQAQYNEIVARFQALYPTQAENVTPLMLELPSATRLMLEDNGAASLHSGRAASIDSKEHDKHLQLLELSEALKEIDTRDVRASAPASTGACGGSGGIPRSARAYPSARINFAALSSFYELKQPPRMAPKGTTEGSSSDSDDDVFYPSTILSKQAFASNHIDSDSDDSYLSSDLAAQYTSRAPDFPQNPSPAPSAAPAHPLNSTKFAPDMDGIEMTGHDSTNSTVLALHEYYLRLKEIIEYGSDSREVQNLCSEIQSSIDADTLGVLYGSYWQHVPEDSSKRSGDPNWAVNHFNEYPEALLSAIVQVKANKHFESE